MLFRSNTEQIKFRFWRVWKRSANGRACISVPPLPEVCTFEENGLSRTVKPTVRKDRDFYRVLFRFVAGTHRIDICQHSVGISRSAGLERQYLTVRWKRGQAFPVCLDGTQFLQATTLTSVIGNDSPINSVGNIVLRDRQHLAEDGIMIVVVTLERHSNVILAGPDIVSRGFVYVRESEDLMDHAREVVENALDSCLERNITDWGKIKTVVKDALSEFLWKRTKRSPMILPIIMEA